MNQRGYLKYIKSQLNVLKKYSKDETILKLNQDALKEKKQLINKVLHNAKTPS
jgi:hypothetical protein